MMVRTRHGRLIGLQDHRGSASKCWNIATHKETDEERNTGRDGKDCRDTKKLKLWSITRPLTEYLSLYNHDTNPKLHNQLQSNCVLVYINTFVVAHQCGWVSLREKETFSRSTSFSLSLSLHRSGLAVSRSHQIWPGFHGWILTHTLSVTTQQSDALRGEMSPLIFICLELI